MSVYSTLLYAGDIGTAVTYPYTVPAGTTAVVRDIEAFNSGASSDHFNMVAKVSGSALTIFSSTTVASNQWYQWKGRLVLPATDELGFVTGANTWVIAVSGYQLS